MRTPQHDSRDRLRIAELAGALGYLAGQIRFHGMTMEQAVAEVRAITTDPHLLSHGLAHRDREDVIVALAVAAGATVEEADAIRAEMHPPGSRGLRLGRRDELG